MYIVPRQLPSIPVVGFVFPPSIEVFVIEPQFGSGESNQFVQSTVHFFFYLFPLLTTLDRLQHVLFGAGSVQKLISAPN